MIIGGLEANKMLNRPFYLHSVTLYCFFMK